MGPDWYTCSVARPPWASVHLEVPSSHPQAVLGKRPMRKSPFTPPYPQVLIPLESPIARRLRPNFAKATGTGTGLGVGPGALVTSALEQVPREGGQGLVSDSRSQALEKEPLQSRTEKPVRPRDQSRLPTRTL